MNMTLFKYLYKQPQGNSGHTFLKAFVFLRYCTIEKYLNPCYFSKKDPQAISLSTSLKLLSTMTLKNSHSVIQPIAPKSS